jgi:hypothetical protein
LLTLTELVRYMVLFVIDLQSRRVQIGGLVRLLAMPDLHAGAALAREAMAVYLREHSEGKLLHDPLAACAIIDRDAFQWKEVEVVYERGQWGANLHAGTGTFITVALDPVRAEASLFTKRND